MDPIRVNFDQRYQKMKLEEYTDSYLFEEGEEDEDPGIELAIEDCGVDLEECNVEIESCDLETDEFDDISLTDDES